MKSYNSMREVIDLLNSNKVNYAILRNYGNLLDDEIYMDGHGDVDVICEDSKEIVKILDAYSQSSHEMDGLGNGTHYYIYINEKKVSLDLRHIGDDYYCREWEENMLMNRVLYNGFYVLSPQDHYYTLIYHAIFQKKEFSEEYRERLKGMGQALGQEIPVASIDFFVTILEKYMKRYNYKYQYSLDRYVPFNKKYIKDKSLFVKNLYRFYEHKKFELYVRMIEIMVSIYHVTFKRK